MELYLKTWLPLEKMIENFKQMHMVSENCTEFKLYKDENQYQTILFSHYAWKS